MRITIGQGNVPSHFLAEFCIESDFALFLGEEHVELGFGVIRQHPKQRCVVLDGVGADDGEPLHELNTVSMASASTFAPSAA